MWPASSKNWTKGNRAEQAARWQSRHKAAKYEPVRARSLSEN